MYKNRSDLAKTKIKIYARMCGWVIGGLSGWLSDRMANFYNIYVWAYNVDLNCFNFGVFVCVCARQVVKNRIS